MPELTKETRVRGHAELERSAEIRVRILAAIKLLSGNCSPLEVANAREQFLRFCIMAAKSRNLRLWHSDYMTTLQSADNSLAILFGEKRTHNGKGTWSTGVNKRWVLEIWEAGLDRFFPSLIEEEHAEIASLADYRRSTVVHLPEEQEKKLFPKTLATRVLDAYHARDDEKMAELWTEIIKLEKKQEVA